MATATSSGLETVTLPHWPSCNNCLASSEDEIVCASGAHIHVLTAKTPDIYQPNPWHISRVKVNSFLDSEWPVQKLAPLNLLSIGEEQSESLVVALSWSPSGLGLHKRAVLAILTSNLVLSLWETDGTLGQFRRTCVVNRFLAASGPKEIEDKDLQRRCQRIRAFAWLPILKADGLPRHGLFYMALADDNKNLCILRITKTTSISFGHFAIDQSSHISLRGPSQVNSQSVAMPSLQEKLGHHSVISAIETTEWQTQTSSKASDKHLSLRVFQGFVRHTFNLSTTIQNGSNVGITISEEKSKSLITLCSGGKTIARPNTQNGLGHGVVNEQSEYVDLERCFRYALKPLIKSFDQMHHLHGNYNVHLWGVCQTMQASTLAACVTLHPSDMIEHTQPSTEKCNIIFARIKSGGRTGSQINAPPAVIREKILQYALRNLQTTFPNPPLIERKLLSNFTALARSSLSSTTTIQILEAELRRHMLTTSDDAAAHARFPNLASESCEVCSAEVPFSSDTASARCITGHVFTRCNLTFLAIQAPGISKYCSGCSRQFLDLAKLGPLEDAHLAQALFEEFDVCPYCGAKYRG